MHQAAEIEEEQADRRVQSHGAVEADRVQAFDPVGVTEECQAGEQQARGRGGQHHKPPHLSVTIEHGQRRT